MRTAASASAGTPRKSSLRINKHETLDTQPVPRGMTEPLARQMENGGGQQAKAAPPGAHDHGLHGRGKGPQPVDDRQRH
jgi:hypothetical protein